MLPKGLSFVQLRMGFPLEGLFQNLKEVSDMFNKGIHPWQHKLTWFSEIDENLKYW